jgi:LysR family transcriptional regulator, cyn operon transcriptional activator
MELRQLKYFMKVAELLNFSEAAKALFITQSTLSQQVKQLETELDVQLFQRSSHDVSLTEAGKELLPYARETLHCADTCVDRIRDLHRLLVGTLNIGATYTFRPILTDTLLTFMKKYTGVKLNIFYKSMEELMGMLEQRDVDFVLSFKPTDKYHHIESHILFDNHLAVIVNSNHPIAQLSSVSLADLQDYDIALPTKGLQARNAFDDMVADRDYKLNVRIELNEVDILMKLIRDSNLVSILSEATIHGEEGLKAVPLDVPNNQMEGCVHVLKNSYSKSSAKEFLRMLSESNAVRERMHDWINEAGM